MYRQLTGALYGVAIGVGLITLVVGGIGIMNIMLVSVTERTREIGVRRALGARRRTILLQFLIESSIVAALGGAVGTALGLGVAQLVALVTPLAAAATPSAVALGIGFSAGGGAPLRLLARLAGRAASIRWRRCGTNDRASSTPSRWRSGRSARTSSARSSPCSASSSARPPSSR